MPTIAQIKQDQYPATDELRCVQIYIPDDDTFLWLLAGILAIPNRESSYEDPESEQALGLAEIWREGYDMSSWGGCVNPAQVGLQNRTTIEHVWAEVVAGAAFVYNSGTNMGGYCFQNVAAINDHFVHPDIWLRAGTYDFKMQTFMTAASAQMQLYVKPIPTGSDIMLYNTIDLYASPSIANALYNTTLTIPADGAYELHGKAPSKRVASTGYNINITRFEFVRTGA